MYRASLTLRTYSVSRPVISSTTPLSDLLSQLSLNPSVSPPTITNNSTLLNYESRRFSRRYRKWYNWPNDFLPFHWERPKQEPTHLRTGDKVRDIGMWDQKALVPGAEHSTELKNAPEIVRRLFSLEFANRKDVVEFQRRRIVQHIQRNPFDTTSHEVRIAEFTVKIRNNLYYFNKVDNDDALRKIRQNGYYLKRCVLLKDLFYQDRDRYNYVKRLLGIEHTPPKLGCRTGNPTRKGELRRLTTEYCDRIKEERLAKYHLELKEKQVTLSQEMSKLDELMKEEKYLGIENKSK